MNINDLNEDFQKDLFRFAEAMQYCFKESSDKENYNMWLEKIKKRASNYDLKTTLERILSKNKEEAKKSPLLKGLYDAYLRAYKTEDEKKLKKIYLAYQKLQDKIPYEKNPQAYYEAGCFAGFGYYEETGDIYLIYPIYLWAAYKKKNGYDDDHRSGYLFPNHKLSEEEVNEIAEKFPYALSKRLKMAREKTDNASV